jgi:hypothetical protein
MVEPQQEALQKPSENPSEEQVQSEKSSEPTADSSTQAVGTQNKKKMKKQANKAKKKQMADILDKIKRSVSVDPKDAADTNCGNLNENYQLSLRVARELEAREKRL